MNVFVFDIETVPDIESGKKLYDLDGLSDKEVGNILFHKRRQESGTEFLRLHLQRIVTVVVCWAIAAIGIVSSRRSIRKANEFRILVYIELSTCKSSKKC